MARVNNPRATRHVIVVAPRGRRIDGLLDIERDINDRSCRTAGDPAPSTVFIIAGVAKILSEDADWTLDVALEMAEDGGCPTAYNINDQSTTAVTRFDIENLKELIEIRKANPGIIEGYPELDWPGALRLPRRSPNAHSEAQCISASSVP